MKSNPWGLYDMHGNVKEWCQDWLGAYPSGAVTDPSGPASGSSRVVRGGSWEGSFEDCSSAHRRGLKPSGTIHDIGFRVCFSLPSKQLDASTNLADTAPKRSSSERSELEPMMAQDGLSLEFGKGPEDAIPPAATTDTPPSANAPFDAATAKEHQEAWAKYLGVEVETENSIGMKLRVIPPGTFTMGNNDGSDREKPAHQVTLTKPFLLGAYEVTEEQYLSLMKRRITRVRPANEPAMWLPWYDAVEFCKRLSALPAERAAGRAYRLPTEAEWEYACRAGTTTKYSSGDDESDLVDYGWFSENSDSNDHPVGGKMPNAWGLHDMHGNAAEWCQDWYQVYRPDAVTDPTGAASSSARVYRGGSSRQNADLARSAYRDSTSQGSHASNIGFRIVCIAKEKTREFNSENSTMSQASEVSTRSTVTPPAATTTTPPPANAPFDAAKAKEHQEAWAKYLGVEVEIENSIGMKVRVIPPGTFTMGSDDWPSDNKPAHLVTLTKPFLLGVYEVTQAQYEKVMGSNPSRFMGPTKPVNDLTWNDSVAFCRKLTALPEEKAAGRVYRLPTEAEWEFACRAGATTEHSFGNDDSLMTEYAWLANLAGLRPIGGKRPNALGLYDMYGNVWEYCRDRYGLYSSGHVTDPLGPIHGDGRHVSRGGGISGSGYESVGLSSRRRVVRDSYSSSNLGFRVCMTLSGQ